MELKCKICAGSLTIDPKTKIAKCDYCGTKQILPMFGDDSSKILYERGNQYLLHNEYDKAEAIFEQLLSVSPGDGEIYWDLVLCKYGVTYAKDPKTEDYIPTCNRTHTQSVFKNPNFIKALELSTEEKGALYKKDAEIIDKIQKGILEVSRKENPFDVFISYKETDANGYRTRDSIEAQKLYEKLTELGYKVFFSRITLESKIGEEYEPIIYAALSSSPVMITVCSSADNIQSAWVKNEWSRFLTLRRGGNMSKTLIPVYFDMDVKDLPEEFALLPAQDLRAEDFEQELIRGIKKLIPASDTKKEGQKQIGKIVGITVALLLLIGAPAIYYLSKTTTSEESSEKDEQILEAGNDQKQNGNIDIQSKPESVLNNDNSYEGNGFDQAAEDAKKGGYYEEYAAAMDLYFQRRYAEATWAFEAISEKGDMTGYIDKCKKAWRAINSTIADDCEWQFSQRFAYYITPNGTVDAFGVRKGNSNVEVSYNSDRKIIEQNDFRLNEHGSIVSIARNEIAYALYEDGFVCNSAYNNFMEEDWSDAIQISDRFNVTSVALLSDGTIAVGNTDKTIELKSGAGLANGGKVTDKWLEEAKEWADIIELEWTVDPNYNSGGIFSGMLIGLDSNGKVHVVVTDNNVINGNWNTDGWIRTKKYVEELNGIKKIRINNYVGEYQNTGVCVTALDQNNVLHILTSEGNTTKEVGPIKDFWVDSDEVTYYIDSQNRLKKIGSDKSILEGVISVNKGFCVSQSGTIYRVDGSSTECKTRIYDVWLER